MEKLLFNSVFNFRRVTHFWLWLLETQVESFYQKILVIGSCLLAIKKDQFVLWTGLELTSERWAHLVPRSLRKCALSSYQAVHFLIETLLFNFSNHFKVCPPL